MKPKVRILFTVAAILLLMITMTACGSLSTEKKVDPSESSNENQEDVGNEDTEAAKPELTSLTISIFYSDDQLMNIVKEEQEIQYLGTEDLISKVWDALQNPLDEQLIDLWQGVELKKASLNDRLLTLDLSLPVDISLGSTGEAMAVQSLIQTYAQIEGVEEIQLTIDGQIQETLAGHVSIDKPFTKDEIIYQNQ